ncbi:hypothetical protein OAS39_06020 [Pirellulales bacterium]|nr:hypothetical protein [Pirellulales bacterium]
MPNRLEIPPELAALIEKREGQERRQGQGPAEQGDLPTEGTIEPVPDNSHSAPDDRRSGGDRRADDDAPPETSDPANP